MMNVTKRLSALAMAGLICAVLPSRASAQEDGDGPTRMVIFPLESSLPEGQNPRLAGELSARLVAESEQRGMRVTRARASFADTMFIAGCAERSGDCYERILDQLGADRGMDGRIEAADGQGRVRVELVHFRRGGEPVTRSFEAEAAAAPGQIAEVAPSLLDGDDGESFLTWDGALATERVSWGSWAAIGGGGALMGTGVVFWILASREQVRVENARTDTPADLERLVAIEDSAQRRATIGNVLFATGVTAAVVGLVLAVQQGRSADAGAPAEPDDSVTLAPMPIRGGLGVTFTMEWSP